MGECCCWSALKMLYIDSRCCVTLTAAGHWIAATWHEEWREHLVVDSSSVDDCRQRHSCCRNLRWRRRHQRCCQLVHGTPPRHQLIALRSEFPVVFLRHMFHSILIYVDSEHWNCGRRKCRNWKRETESDVTLFLAFAARHVIWI